MTDSSDDEIITDVLGCPGFLRCGGYQAVDNVSSTKYMDLYEVAAKEALTSTPFRDLREVLGEYLGRGTLYGQRPSPWLVTLETSEQSR